MKKYIIIILLILFATSLIFITRIFTNPIINTVDNIETNINTSTKNIKWSDYKDSEISLSESITITEEGIYNLTGQLNDGMITIETEGNVKLVLNNVTITNSNGPAIYVKKADNVTIYLSDNSINTLTDSSTYNGYDEDVNGVIYSKDDIELTGTGTLIIKANYQDGIVSKDDLVITNGNYQIESVDDGIRGKDSVYILDGTFDIKAGGDAIKSTNDSDITKGYVKIDNATFNLVAANDGIEAITDILISNGNINITTGGGSSNSSSKMGWNTSSTGCKGIKTNNNIIITGGNIILDTSDDSIHSNNYVGIKNTSITITSGDDGIHADNEIIIDSGKIDIKKSYEGIEAAKIVINGGTINVVSSDDGINVAGGNDSSSFNRPGQNSFVNTTNSLNITGGSIYVNASGDGLDANGSIYITGGNIIVDGPTDNGNGALDYDGVLNISSGSLIAVGSSGMAQGVSNTSTQNGVLINLSTYPKDTIIKIVDSNNNEIMSYKANKAFSSITYSSNLLTNGTYKLYLNDTLYTEFTVSSVSTKIGNTGMGGMREPGADTTSGATPETGRQRMR